MYDFKNPFEHRIIYILSIDDPIHRGLLKIGETTVKAVDNPDRTLMESSARSRIN